MATRRLFDVAPNADYQFDFPVSFANIPDLAVAFSSAIASCSQVDCWFGNVLTMLLGESPAVALAMLQEDRSTELQVRKINAAASQRLQTEELMLFEAAMDVAKAPMPLRHTLAHGLVGSCPNVPNAILVADPRDFQVLFLRAFKNHRGLPSATKDELKAASVEFCKKISVYTSTDLDEVTKQFEQSVEILMNLSTLCAPAHHAKAKALLYLNSVPEIMRRVQKKKKSARKAKSTSK